MQQVTPAHGGPASQTIPPATRRAIMRAFKNRCAVPGCRCAIWLDAHHYRPWSEEGSHEPENLVPLCSTHHRRVHDGQLVIERRDEQFVFLHPDGTVYVWHGRLEATDAARRGGPVLAVSAPHAGATAQAPRQPPLRHGPS